MQFKVKRELESKANMAKQSVSRSGQGKLWPVATARKATNQRPALVDSCTSPIQKRQSRQQWKQLRQHAPQDAKSQAATTRRTFRTRLSWLLLLVAASLAVLAAASPGFVSSVSAMAEESSPRQQQSQADTKAALEAELNAILQQQQQQQQESAPNSKLLSEAIISRLMLGNMSDIGAQDGESAAAAGPMDGLQLADDENAYEADSGAGNLVVSQQEAQRLRRILSYLRNYEIGQQYPVLPMDQAATIKRATIKMGNYLRQQSQHQHGGQRQLSGYGRVNSFDFGLGKRPDSSAGAANILRLGDSASVGPHLATISGSGLGKRPSAHRYDFGLGKRVASPSYPRYDFGLGKRAPGSRLRYDFGLGK